MLAHRQVLTEGPEISRVHSDHGSVDRQRAIQLRLVVHLHEHVQLEVAGQLVELTEQDVVRNGRGNEENRVGPDASALVDLVGIDREVLAQDRGRRRGVAGLLEVGNLNRTELPK